MNDLWLDILDADLYFATRLGAADYWATGVDKAAALATGQRYIEASGLFTFEDADGNDLTEDPTVDMQDAVCEQALFLLRDPVGIEARAALQAQGVTAAGIVQESFAGGPVGVVLAPLVPKLLRGYLSASNGSFAVER